MPGKVWTAQEEAELKTLVEANTNVNEVALKLNKTPKAIITKCQRLGLQLQIKGYISTKVSLPRELPSIEEATKILGGAMRDIIKPGLNKLDVQRLQVAANISKAYKEQVVDYAHYRDVELQLKEIAKQNAELQRALKEMQARSPSVQPQPVSN